MDKVIGFVCAATAFPAMLFERPLPIPPTAEALTKGMNSDTDTKYHYYKNIWTETVRADCQYWGKLLAFVISVLGSAVLW